MDHKQRVYGTLTRSYLFDSVVSLVQLFVDYS